MAAAPVTVHALNDNTAAAAGGGSGGGSSSSGVRAARAASPLFRAPLRGNLANDSSFIQAVGQKDYPQAEMLYANDDGTHTIVIGGTVQPTLNGIPAWVFTVLIGPHHAQVSQLKRAEGFVGDDAGLPPTNLTYVSALNTTGASVPYVVLGPTDMTGAEYATSAELQITGDKLVLKRTDISQIPLTDGAGSGELKGTDTVATANSLSKLLAFRGTTKSGASVSLQTMLEVVQTPPAFGDISSTTYDPIRDEVVVVAQQNGVTVDKQGPGGDEVTDNTAQVVEDLADFAGVDPSAVSVQVK